MTQPRKFSAAAMLLGEDPEYNAYRQRREAEAARAKCKELDDLFLAVIGKVAGVSKEAKAERARVGNQARVDKFKERNKYLATRYLQIKDRAPARSNESVYEEILLDWETDKVLASFGKKPGVDAMQNAVVAGKKLLRAAE